MTKSKILGFGTTTKVDDEPVVVAAGRSSSGPQESTLRVEPGHPALFIGGPPPSSLASLITAYPVVGEDARAWSAGEHALLTNSAVCHWDGTAWVEGVAP